MLLNHSFIARGSFVSGMENKLLYHLAKILFFKTMSHSVKMNNLQRPLKLRSAWKCSCVSYGCCFSGNLAPFLHTFSPAISTVSPPKVQTFTLHPRPCSGVHYSFRHCLLSCLWPRSVNSRCLASFLPNEVMLPIDPAFTQS